MPRNGNSVSSRRARFRAAVNNAGVFLGTGSNVDPQVGRAVESYRSLLKKEFDIGLMNEEHNDRVLDLSPRQLKEYVKLTQEIDQAVNVVS